jgi:phenylpropionate dioxygenase-like ring-hydroxylating dioxygenase large terminal subunit
VSGAPAGCPEGFWGSGGQNGAVTSFACNPALRGYWHAVARPDAVLAGPLAVTLLGERLVVWRAPEGRLAAAVDRCPHREAPLSAGTVVDLGLQCPYHGWTYDADGCCVLVPSAGLGAAVPPRAVLQRVHVAERYGLLWLCLDEPVAPIPEIAEDTDRDFRRINQPVEQWAASATRLVDNFLDTAHFPFVHLGSFGGAADPEVARMELEPLGDFYGYQYEVVAANAMGAEASGQTGATVERRMSTGFALPLLVRSTIEYATGLRHTLLLTSAPIDDGSTWFTFVVWRNDDFSVPGDEVTRLDRLIGAEDKRMLEQVAGPLPLDATTLVNVQADRASVEWRRRFKTLLDER